MAKTQESLERENLAGNGVALVLAGSPKAKAATLLAWVAFGVPFSFSLLIYFLTGAGGLSFHYGGEDGGDLALAFAVGGIPHPTGYPLYLVVNRLFLLWQAEPARALVVASAFWGALAAGTTALVTYRLLQKVAAFGLYPRLAGSLFSGLGLAVAPLVWSQSLIVEINSFDLVLNSVLILALVWWWDWEKEIVQKQKNPLRSYLPNLRLGILALVAGLAAGQHRTALASVVAVLLFILSAKKEVPVRKGLLASLIFIFALIIPYLYLVVRAGSVPSSNWANPGLYNPSGLWQEFSGSEYHYLLFAAPLTQSLGRLGSSLSLLVQEFGLLGLALGWLGVVLVWRKREVRPLAYFVTAGLVLHTGFAAIYAAENSQVYLLPAFALWAVVMGFGLVWFCQLLSAALATWGRPKEKDDRVMRFGPTVLAWLTLLLFLAAGFFANYTRLDLKKDNEAEGWAQAQLLAAPAKAIILTYSDAATFALGYEHYAHNTRADVALIDTRLLREDWYRYNLARLYPDLELGVKAAFTPEDVALNNPSRPVIVVVAPPGKESFPFS